MRRSIGSAYLALAVASVATLGLAEEAPQQPPMSPEEQAMMERWTAFMTPGAAHKLLDSRVGTWDFTVKMWMAPGAPPDESKGTSETRWIMGGRYIEDVTLGEFQGQPFEGRGITGYDNLKKKYVSLWFDSMGTGLMTGEGTYDAASKTFHYLSTGSDPMTGTTKTVRLVDKILGPDSFINEMYDTGPDGKEFKSMEITYTRKK